MTDSDNIEIMPAVAVPRTELRIAPIRAGGPGGQHVNKTSTAIELRFDLANSDAFTPEQRAQVLAYRDRRINAAGTVVIKARRFRSQTKNRNDAESRLVGLLRTALERDPPRKVTRTPAAERRKRLQAKNRRSRLKSLRRTPAE